MPVHDPFSILFHAALCRISALFQCSTCTHALPPFALSINAALPHGRCKDESSGNSWGHPLQHVCSHTPAGEYSFFVEHLRVCVWGAVHVHVPRLSTSMMIILPLDSLRAATVKA